MAKNLKKFLSKDYLSKNMYLILAIIAILVLSFILMRKDSSECFKQCVCQQGGTGRERACQDVTTVNNLYVTGQLTETSQLPDKGWTTVSPGDMSFPVSNGCNWCNDSSEKKPEWQKWDYTDFGN
jgi:hypothetical protein